MQKIGISKPSIFYGLCYNGQKCKKLNRIEQGKTIVTDCGMIFIFIVVGQAAMR